MLIDCVVIGAVIGAVIGRGDVKVHTVGSVNRTSRVSPAATACDGPGHPTATTGSSS